MVSQADTPLRERLRRSSMRAAPNAQEILERSVEAVVARER